jgi:Ca-activated chloride channel family protein
MSRDMRRATTVVAVAGLVVLALLLQDRRSVERGNRLYHEGDVPSAAETYAGALDGRGDASATTYNLGTALISLDRDSAGAVLRAAAQSEDRAVRQKSLYNLGYQLITSLGGLMTVDSTQAILVEAVAVGREALRLDPTDEDARWNLAVAQRRLDAMIPPGDDTGRQSSGESDDEVAMNNPEMARSEDSPAESGVEPEDPRAADNPGERSGPRQGAREAWATQDPGPLTREEALGLLSDLRDDPELLLRGILWSHRPDVAWWSGQPYPGGRW